MILVVVNQWGYCFDFVVVVAVVVVVVVEVSSMFVLLLVGRLLKRNMMWKIVIGLNDKIKKICDNN